jgi:DNA-binding beta-propeller fold protein YncE
VSVGIDPFGTRYVADMGASTVRRIDKGVVSTVMGQPGIAGSVDGPGVGGLLNHPRALTVSPDGNYIYIADTDNDEIRLFNPKGNGIYFGPIITTLAGSAGAQGTADGDSSHARFTAPGGIAMTANYTLYVGDSGTDRVRQLVQGFPALVSSVAGVATSAGTNDGPASTAQFNAPTGVATDSAGNLFIADTGNDIIRRVGTDGIVSTVAGVAGAPGFADGVGSAARFNAPTSLVFDSLGNLFVADTGNHAIRRIAPSYLVSTVIGTGTPGHQNGAGTASQLNSPRGLAFDGSGTLLYVADTGNNVIRVASTKAPTVTAAPPRRRAVMH